MCDWTCHIFDVFLLLVVNFRPMLVFKIFICALVLVGRLCLALHCKLYPYI